MPFGVSSAVHHFNRASEALEAVLQHIFGVPCSRYFDGFITFLLPKSLATPSELVKDVFGLLGWPLRDDKIGRLEAPEAPGVKFDLRDLFAPQPVLRVTNTERRAKALRESIGQIFVGDQSVLRRGR